MIARKLSACLLVLALTVSAFAIVSFGARADEGGPDAYGYTWTDSNSPDPTVSFNWIEISGVGIEAPVTGDDNFGGPYPIGFDFEFYGNTYSMFNLSTNGLMQFAGSSSAYYNYPIPSTGSPNNIIAPYWDDLCIDFGGYNTGTIYYQTLGTTPNQQLVVEYYEVSRLGEFSQMTFEIILNETGEIWFQYLSLNGVTGGEATVGIEDSTGEAGCEYSYNEVSLADGLAIVFEMGPIGFTPYSQVMADWGAVATHEITVRNVQAFADGFDIAYTSYEGWTVALYDSTMTPLADNGGSPDLDTGTIASGDSVVLYVEVTVPPSPTVFNESTFLTATSWNSASVTASSLLSTTTPLAYLGASHTDYGDDDDTDGDYDWLVVNVAIDAGGAGYLNLEAELYDGVGAVISYASDLYYVSSSGSWVLPAAFSGTDIFLHGVDGPYTVDIFLYDEYWNILDAEFDYVTGAYLYVQFDPPPAIFGSPHSSVAVDDGDSNSQYDYLLVNATVMVYDAGTYIIEAYIEDDFYGWYIDSTDVSVYMDAGENQVGLVFPALAINESYLDGPYVAHMYLFTDSYDYLDYDSHTTDAYLYDDFEGPRVLFLEPFADWAEDTDDDGYYNTLTVTAYFDCLEAGDYPFEVDVWDPSYSYFAYFSETLSLPEGTYLWYNTTITSDEIWPNMESGNWYFEHYLWDSSWDVLYDYCWYETAYYDYMDFDAVGAYFGAISDDVLDSDSDGYYNDIVVNVTVDPASTGDFVLVAYVYDYYSSWSMYVSEAVYLEEGVPYLWQIVIPGYDIYLEWLYSPFDLYLYTYDETESYEYDYEYYETAYYYPGNFDPIGAYFYDVSDEGVDTDSDGYYNEVVLTVLVDAEPTGYFMLRAYVYDYYYDWMMTVEEVVYIEEGVQFAWEIVVTDEMFVTNGVNGYIYLDLYAYDEVGSYYFDYMYYYSSYYYVDDFDRVGAYLEPPYEDYGLDEDGDGLYDWLVFTLYVNASSSGYYDVSVYARDYYYYYGEWFWFTLYLVEGERTAIDVMISSADIWHYAYDGYWYFDMDTYDSITWTNYDWDSYWTDTWYYRTDFDPLGAEFDWPHSDYGMDTDDDTLYDLFILEIAVYCYDPGEYTVDAAMFVGGLYFASASETEVMSVGNNVVLFVFDGWLIYNTYMSYNSIRVDLEIADERGAVNDQDTYYTSYYYYWQFESPPTVFSPPHSDYAVDDDADSLFEWLIVNASITSSFGGEYWVFGELYDWDYEFIDAFVVPASLVEGENEVQLFFDGWLIANNYYEPYYVYMELYDYAGYIVDADSHYLGAYYDQSDFDPAPPEIASGWAYESPSIDGSVSAGEWFGATEVDVMAADPLNEIEASMYVMNNGTHLFVLIDAVGDQTASVGDLASVSFDTGNDEAWTGGGEDMFVLGALYLGTLTAHAEYDDSSYWDVIVHCAPFDAMLPGHEGLAGAIGFGPSDAASVAHRVYELCIPLALLDVSPGDVIGFGGVSLEGPMVYDADEGEYSSWPVSVEYFESLGLLGDLVLSEERPLTTLEMSGDAGLAGWFMSDVEVSMTATGGTGGVNATYYSVDGGAWTVYDDSFVVSEDGVHELMYYSDDMAGNAEPVRTALVMIDTVAPEVSASVEGTMGLEGWVVSGAAVSFTVTDESSGLSTMMCRVDGGDWEEISGTTMSMPDDGSHTVEYYAVDVAGHESEEASVTIKVDTAPPVTNASVDGSSVTLLATDGDGSGVSATMYRIDGGDWKTYEGEFVVKGEGTHVLEYYSVDVAGLNETVKSVSVEGKAGILGLDAWVWAVIIAAIVAVVVLVLFMLMKRRPPQPTQMIPGQAVVEQGGPEPPPPPQT